MAQFDVHWLEGGQLVVDCQNDLFEHFRTRFVVPLVTAADTKELDRLHPIFEIDGKSFIFAAHLGSAIPSHDIGKSVTSLNAHRYVILNAIDMLITGY